MNIPASAVLWLTKKLKPKDFAIFENFMYEYDEIWAEKKLKEARSGT